MALSYYQVRFLHCKGTLAAWLKGLDKAAFSVVATIGPGLFVALGFLIMAAADSLSMLIDSRTNIVKRAFIVIAWQLGTLILLRSFREAVFMPRARLFFDSLPIAPIDKLKTDIAISLQCYSVLWLSIAWAAVVTMTGSDGVEGALSLFSIAAFIGLGLCINLLVLRDALQASVLAILGFAAFILADTPTWLGFFGQLGALTLGGASLWRAYSHPQETTRYLIRSPVADRLAIVSGLLIPFLLNELRVTLMMRVAAIGGALSLCAILLSIRESSGSTIGAFVFIAAVAVISLYSLPELCRSIVLSKLDFIAGQRHFRRRLAIAAYAIPTLLFVITLLAAHSLANYFGAPVSAPKMDFVQQAILPMKFFTTAYIFGAIASRLGVQSVTWVVPLLTLVAAIVLSGLI